MLSAIVSSSDDAIIGKNIDGIITSWNRAAERIFGYTAGEAIGQSIRLIVPPGHYEEEDDVLRRIRAGEGVDHYETVRCARDAGRRGRLRARDSPPTGSIRRAARARPAARDPSRSASGRPNAAAVPRGARRG